VNQHLKETQKKLDMGPKVCPAYLKLVNQPEGCVQLGMSPTSIGIWLLKFGGGRGTANVRKKQGK
jgi:hypothetical protein